METHSLDTWSVLIIVSLAQGLFVLSLILLKGRFKGANGWLFALMIGFLWLQAEFLAVRLPYNVGLNVFYGTRYGSWMLLGPLYFFYISRAFGNPLLFKQLTAHLLPFLLFTIITPSVFEGFLNFRQIHYGMLTPFDHFNQTVSIIQYLYSGIFICQFVHFLAYLFVAERLIKSQEVRLKRQVSNYDQNNFIWLKTLNRTLFLILIFATVFLLIFFFTQIYRRHLDYIYVLPMSMLMYLAGYKLAGVNWTKPASEISKKYQKSSLRSDLADKYAFQLAEYIDRDKPYLNNELRLQDIALALDIPAHHLSQVFNEQLNTTFFDYINKMRVEMAKTLIAHQRNSSLLEIAFECGFNNKTSFVNAFKKFTGFTPSAYRQELVVSH